MILNHRRRKLTPESLMVSSVNMDSNAISSYHLESRSKLLSNVDFLNRYLHAPIPDPKLLYFDDKIDQDIVSFLIYLFPSLTIDYFHTEERNPKSLKQITFYKTNKESDQLEEYKKILKAKRKINNYDPFYMIVHRSLDNFEAWIRDVAPVMSMFRIGFDGTEDVQFYNGEVLFTPWDQKLGDVISVVFDPSSEMITWTPQNIRDYLFYHNTVTRVSHTFSNIFTAGVIPYSDSQNLDNSYDSTLEMTILSEYLHKVGEYGDAWKKSIKLSEIISTRLGSNETPGTSFSSKKKPLVGYNEFMKREGNFFVDHKK